ncbi:hypothetical protein EUGRSUZ_K03546, partial [Eucalyptus grandis]
LSPSRSRSLTRIQLQEKVDSVVSSRDRCGRMAGHKIAHATLKGPSVVKEILIGITLGLAAGGVWKMHHWNEQRKVRAFYDLLEKGEISVVAEE